MTWFTDALSLLGMALFFRIPFIIATLYACDEWLTTEPADEPKPWESISLS